MAEEREWYFKDSVVVMAILTLMIVALPLVWFSPYYSLRRKIIVSIIVTVGTYYTWQLTASSLKSLQSYTDILK